MNIGMRAEMMLVESVLLVSLSLLSSTSAFLIPCVSLTRGRVIMTAGMGNRVHVRNGQVFMNENLSIPDVDGNNKKLPDAKLEAGVELPVAKLEAINVNKEQLGIGAESETQDGLELEPRAFLVSLMSSRTAQADKTKLLETARQLRTKGDPVYTAFLERLLQEVDGVAENSWAMTRWPIPLPSYRLKLGCLNRMVTELLKEGMDENVRREGVRARTLAVLLRQLETSQGVRKLEAEAGKAKLEVSMADMLKRTPDGLETPKYQVAAEKGSWEVREYEEFSVCSFDMKSSPEKAGFGAFNALAGYIFGKNQEQLKMAMTTPGVYFCTTCFLVSLHTRSC